MNLRFRLRICLQKLYLSISLYLRCEVRILSVTLLEAQHMCWKVFHKLNTKLNRSWNPFIMVTDILEEAGEVASVVKGLEGFKPPDKPKTKEMLAAELSDLLYMIFALAEHYRINLGESFLQTVNDYALRLIL
jgi:NTP pyrophosphatase (non-canonical NTP hydrolase)